MASPLKVPGYAGSEVSRVVIAPDKFKGSLSATEAAEAIAHGLRQKNRDLQIDLHPVSDGGDGLVAGLLQHGFNRRLATVSDPLGRPVHASYAIRGDTAVVEMAAASGMELLNVDELDPWRCSTYGTGQLIAAAVAQGASNIVVGLGGSATCDGGAGILAALGVRLLDAAGRSVEPVPAALEKLHQIDLSEMPPSLRGVQIVVASDVHNRLLGPNGAVSVFGPQKGAKPDQLFALEERMHQWADALESCTGRRVRDRPGTGAAGGVSFALAAVFDAAINPGIELFLELSGFDEVVAGARLVITGEGRFDEQTLGGKAPLGVCQAAARQGVPTIAVAGRTTLTSDHVRDSGFAGLYTLASVEADEGRCMQEAPRLLSLVAGQLAEDFLLAESLVEIDDRA